MTHLKLSKHLSITQSENLYNLPKKCWIIASKKWFFNMKGAKRCRKTQFGKGHKCTPKITKWCIEPQRAEFVRPKPAEVELMNIEPTIHEAMASTSTVDDTVPQYKFLRAQDRQPKYTYSACEDKDNIRYAAWSDLIFTCKMS